ncbi:AEC family transporter [Gynuella sunshinyii]|uniref:Putative permease n=1 Tax=Gynuella sunshinyii YC6258 TaxID=1445510 RepID=A0A0C5VCQ6_9GAMM|nr:AEC family transporter [Gynuella sunshinyii]AJQ97120.1 putative permease [Gynuella sunshinyii YC6258]
MTHQILGIIIPIIFIVLIGFAYGKRHRPDMEAANRINVDVFVPLLIISVFADKGSNMMAFMPLVYAVIAVTLIPGVFAFALARGFGFNWKTFVPPIMFKNSGNMGLPLVLFAYGEQYLPAAVVMFVVSNTLHFTVGAWLINPNARMWDLIKNPMILATITGLGIAFLGVTIPAPLVSGMQLVGNTAVPLMLFALGVRLVNMERAGWKIGLISAIACPLLGIMVAWPITQIWDLGKAQTGILILFGALPPAVLNYLVAERYKQQPDLVASMVIYGNAFSVVIIPLALAWVL